MLRLLKRCSEQYRVAPILIAIAHKNQAGELRRALSSALNQSLVKRGMAQVVVLDDQSDARWQVHVRDLLTDPAVTELSAECGSPARARNQLLDWADRQPSIEWVARLDADDEFVDNHSLEALLEAPRVPEAVAVVGSNALRQGEEILPWVNRANAEELFDLDHLTAYVKRFSSGEQERELPSCNLVLKNRLGLRYPNTRSAEDHWLLCNLIIKYPGKVCAVSDSLYCIYKLGGTDTSANRSTGVWHDQRQRLAYFLERLNRLKKGPFHIVGYGMEGIVWWQGEQLVKEFYPWAMPDEDVERLDQLLANAPCSIPEVTWIKANGVWQYRTPRLESRPVGTHMPKETLSSFLQGLYRSRICALNIKRDNLRLDNEGNLLYIDIGKDICGLSTSLFLDMAARLYSIGVLGNDDEELVRRLSWRTQDESLGQLPGFSDFYRELMEDLHSRPMVGQYPPLPAKRYDQVTLLIKACAQDAQGFFEQVSHIVHQLAYPASFAQILVLIDDHPGPFLRQYAEPDLPSLIEQTEQLKKAGIVDGYLIPPADTTTIQEVYDQWFNSREVVQTHTTKNAPLYPQIWAFSVLDTPYVLQCDCDALVGRKSWNHDFLADMLDAIRPKNVVGVGFNIPKWTDLFLEYFGEPGQFAPEVRFGLLDLQGVKEHLPINNPVENGRFKLTWHRAIQQYQRSNECCTCVRGGDPASFYVHPQNTDKPALRSGVIRDLIAQGILPAHQEEQFDLVVEPEWQYPERGEPVIFLLKGRCTPAQKLHRCLDSLARQTDQSFGVILIDDASGFQKTWYYPMMLSDFEGRYTLVRHAQRKGRMPNFLLAIHEICARADSLIVVLDQDDFLMRDDVVAQLLVARSRGSDLIQMPMYRPDKPLKLYQPDYRQPRKQGAGNTWAHLRGFRKSLFQKVPERYFKRPGGDWFDCATDYATMLPMSELAENPAFLDTGYAYWHERAPYSASHKAHQAELIPEILANPIAKELAEPTPVDEECGT
ncbi:glycosyltransferase family 2 protein [Marinobacter sp. M216]|uniref:Glycosyltransferase family 2 protein n=1 Tax=Marinobacter albus TaxID=3030833 RepID=A0ABT7HAY0_9GAMM|nr:glycosyltransferase family 2 protein [Marinobacter sp. M216]MDK9556660.1 glycosyltransferase family 2 protein [Marinobacter sp. M216]